MTTQEDASEHRRNGSPHLLVGIDVYQDEDSPLERAFALAALVPKTHIDVVWAPPIMATPLDGSVRHLEGALDLLRDRVLRVVEKFGAERLRLSGAEVSLQIAEGRPAPAICRAAFQNGADLVIVGAQDKGKLETTVVGSVSRRLVQEAPCPVLVVRPKFTDFTAFEEPPDQEPRKSYVGHRGHYASRSVKAREDLPLHFPSQR